jgi:hypothetical protein
MPDKQIPPDDCEPRFFARPDVNQRNIDRVTAELGRHAGDVGEKKRLAVLMQNRRSDIALEGAKTRAKKAGPRGVLLPVARDRDDKDSDRRPPRTNRAGRR